MPYPFTKSLDHHGLVAGFCKDIDLASIIDHYNFNLCRIENRYEIKFLEIGSDEDHIHFLIQSVPMYSITKLVTMIKSLTAREVFKKCPHVKKQLWGGEFWSDGYFASTVGKHGDESMIRKYVKNQGNNYEQLHCDHQLVIF
jgi:REP element-mobilizing transposase RayT